MSRVPAVTLRFPAAGLDRKYGYQNQPPFTTPDCLNVRPDGSISDRQRGGSRPGLVKAFDTQIGSGLSINMLNDVEISNSDGISTWIDDFQAYGLDAYTACVQSGFTGLPGLIRAGRLPPHVANFQKRGVYRTDIQINTEAAYLVTITAVPQGNGFASDFYLFACLDQTTPDISSEGIILRVELRGANYIGNMIVRGMASGNGDYAIANCNLGTFPAVTTITLKVDPVNQTVEPFVQGVSVATAVNVGAIPATQHAFGFGTDAVEQGAEAFVDQLRVTFSSELGDQTNTTLLVAAANGKIYRELTPTTLTSAVTATTVASDVLLQAAERGGKLYIADYSEDPVARKTQADGCKVSGTTRIVLSGSSFDWSTSGNVNTTDHIAKLTSTRGGTGEDDGIYRITKVSGNVLDVIPAANGNGFCTVEVLRGPKVYDPKAGTLTELIPKSATSRVPGSCPFVARYRDRIVWAAGSNWYMSRLGDPLDYDYGTFQNVATRPVAGASSDAGDLPNNITAVVAFSDDYLLFASRNELYILTGDPALFSGSLNNVSRKVGIIDKLAWCDLPDGSLAFMAHDGLYLLPPGGRGKPQPLSQDRLPDELRDFDTKNNNVILAYDDRNRGIMINVTQKVGEGGVFHFFDLDTASFWPEQYTGTHEGVSMTWHNSSVASDSALLMGGRDGYIRKHEQGQPNDDGTQFESRVMMGPINLGRNGMEEGAMTRITLDMGEGSGNVDVEVFADDTAESTVTGTSKFTAEIGAGDNRTVRPRVRGKSAAVQIKGKTNSIWALETASLVMRGLGKHRKEG
jgi:hypothetical protein